LSDTVKMIISRNMGLGGR